MLSGHIRWCRPEFEGLIVGPHHCHSLLARRSVHGEAEDYDAKDSIAAGSEGLSIIPRLTMESKASPYCVESVNLKRRGGTVQ
jgi:hypothetical protein